MGCRAVHGCLCKCCHLCCVSSVLLKYSSVDRSSQSPAAKVAASNICSVDSKCFCGKQNSNKRLGLVPRVVIKVVYNLVRRNMHTILIWGCFLTLVNVSLRDDIRTL